MCFCDKFVKKCLQVSNNQLKILFLATNKKTQNYNLDKNAIFALILTQGCCQTFENLAALKIVIN